MAGRLRRVARDGGAAGMGALTAFDALNASSANLPHLLRDAAAATTGFGLVVTVILLRREPNQTPSSKQDDSSKPS